MNKKSLIILCVGGCLLFCSGVFAQENEEATEDKNLARFDQVIELLQDAKLANKERADLLFEKASLMFETFGPMYLRTATESLLEAIELEPNNNKFRDYLHEIYSYFWKDKDLNGDDDVSVALKALRNKVKRELGDE